MQPFRKHLVLSVDGGGLRGIIPALALAIAERELVSAHKTTWHVCISVAAGTSTGSIISAALLYGLKAENIVRLYQKHGAEIFTRTSLLPDLLTEHIFDNEPLRRILDETFGSTTLADLWKGAGKTKLPGKDLIIAVRDLCQARTRFLKSWKDSAEDWLLSTAVLASTAVPTQFPVVEGRYVDGGLGSYSNPTYIAVFEALKVWGWSPADVTVLSLGTGRSHSALRPGQADHYHVWDWVPVILDAFLSDASEQQLSMVRTFMGEGLDLRRFQVNFKPSQKEPSATNPDDIPLLMKYGEEMGRMMLADEWEPNVAGELKLPA